MVCKSFFTFAGNTYTIKVTIGEQSPVRSYTELCGIFFCANDMWINWNLLVNWKEKAYRKEKIVDGDKNRDQKCI